jgi:hypothetical protein
MKNHYGEINKFLNKKNSWGTKIFFGLKLLLIIFLFGFSIFWEGAEAPDFENAPRQFTIGKYHCPKVGGRGYGNAKIEDIPYYHNWSKIFGFWTRTSSCSHEDNGKIFKIEWIKFHEKRVIISITDPVTGSSVVGYKKQLSYLKNQANNSDYNVKSFRIGASLLAMFLLFKIYREIKGYQYEREY